MGPQRNGFVSCVVDDRYQEVGRVVGRTRQRHWVDRPYVAPPADRIRRLGMGLRRALKWLVRALYVAPVLLVVKGVVGLFAPAASDFVTVVFVCLVVCFFLLLNPYLLVSAIAFRFGKRGRASLRLPFSSSGADALGLLSASARACPDEGAAPPAPGTTLRARGTLVELGPPVARGEPILLDLWLPDAKPPGRATEVADFAVLAEGKMPVVVHCTSAPTVIARPERKDVAEALGRMAEETRATFDRDGPLSAISDGAEGHWITLREGDEVELVGVVADGVKNVESFDLEGTIRSVPRRGGPAAPYRGTSARSGVLLVCNAARPVHVRRVAARGARRNRPGP